MKSLRVVSFFIVLLISSISISIAQSAGSHLSEEQQEQLQESLEEYFAVMDLSEEQKTEFEEITKKYAQQMKAVKDAGGNKMKMYRQVKSIRKDKDAEMEELLSKEQYEVYLEKQDEIQQKMREKRS